MGKRKNKTAALSIRITQKTKDALQRQADSENKSITKIIENVLIAVVPNETNELKIIEEIDQMLVTPDSLSISEWLKLRNLISQIKYKKKTGENIVIQYEEDGISI